MAISFNQISADIRTPGTFVEFDNSRAVQGLATQPHTVLLVGYRTSTGTVDEQTLKRTLSAAQAETFFGVDSPVAAMVRAYKEVDDLTETWVIALDEESGTSASGSFAITGTATEDGTLALHIGDRRYEITVTSGDTASEVGDLVDTKVAADARALATTSNTTGTVTVTAILDGTWGNDIVLEASPRDGDFIPAGLSINVTGMSSGATDPDMADVVTAMGDTQFHTLVTMFNDDTAMDVFEAEYETRWGASVQKEGHIFAAIADTVGNSTTAGNARNSQFSTLVAAQETPTPPWLVAAQVAARDAAQTQIDPARPRQTLKLPSVTAPGVSDRWTRGERDTALTDGLATLTYDDATGDARIERLITTYQTNATGTLDTSYLDVTTMRTLAFLRFSLRARIALRYPRHKLAADGTLFDPGQAIATPSVIRSEVIALFREWQSIGLVEAPEQFKDELIVEINGSDPNRVDVRLSPDLMNQFRVFAGQIQFLL